MNTRAVGTKGKKNMAILHVGDVVRMKRTEQIFCLTGSFYGQPFLVEEGAVGVIVYVYNSPATRYEVDFRDHSQLLSPYHDQLTYVK